MQKFFAFFKTFWGIVIAVASVIGALAPVLFTWLSPQAAVLVRQQTVPYRVPEHILQPDHRDTIIAKQDTLLSSYYSLVLELTPMQLRYKLRDSVNKHQQARQPIRYLRQRFQFELLHKLTVLNLENVGDKTLKGVTLVHPSQGYFEYSLNSDQLRKGRFPGKLQIEDLASGEKREIFFWGEWSWDDSAFRITHDDGALTAEIPVEASGWVRWFADHKVFIEIMFQGLLYLAITWGGIMIWIYRQQKRQIVAEENVAED